jgi:FG-GAP repeat
MSFFRLGALYSAAFVSLFLSECATAETKTIDSSPKTETGSPYRFAELTASDGVAGNTLGIAVAVSGSTVVVGENCTEIGGNPDCDLQHQGVVYVYRRPQNGWSNMVQTAELTASDGYAGDLFGESVAIDGDTIVVGALDKAYVFVNSAGVWQNQTETAELTDGATGDYFGSSVAVENNTIVVGATGVTVNGNGSQGAAYVFVEPAGGWLTTAAFNAQLTASDGAPQDCFGFSVGISGATIVVGAPFHLDQTGPGETYVFTRPKNGWTTATETAILTRSPQGPYDEFGLSVAIDNDTVVVGAQQAVGENKGQGVVDVFVEPSGGWVSSTQTAELASPVAYVQHFGGSVGVFDSEVVVGGFSFNNFIFVFDKPAKGWQSTDQASAQLKVRNGLSWFGFSVAIGDSGIVSGAPFKNVDGNADQGAAFVFSK